MEAEGYKVGKRGTILTPGKFEGEPWQAVMVRCVGELFALSITEADLGEGNR